MDVLKSDLEKLRERLRELEEDLESAKAKVRGFEERFGMTSEEFARRYRSGRLSGDEYEEWFAELTYIEYQSQGVESLRNAIRMLARQIGLPE